MCRSRVFFLSVVAEVSQKRTRLGIYENKRILKSNTPIVSKIKEMLIVPKRYRTGPMARNVDTRFETWNDPDLKMYLLPSEVFPFEVINMQR